MSQWKILAFALLIGGTTSAAASPDTAGPANEDPDRRFVLELLPDERDLVLSEMRHFVVSLQQITDALAREDYSQVAAAARRMGTGAAGDVPPRVVKKLPADFKQLAGKVHRMFDTIALDAEAMGDTQITLEQLARLMQHCVACHAVYQIEKVAYPQ